MQQFPVEWQVSFDGDYDSALDLYCSQHRLNKEWTLICYWGLHENDMLKLDSIFIRRIPYKYEKWVFGMLTLRKRNQTETTATFSNLMESETPLNALKFNDLFPQELFSMHDPTSYFSLHGVVNIASYSEKCTSFDTGVCKNCIQMPALLQLSNDFESLLDPETCCFSDVNLKCGDTSIPAHKIILSARSPVFAAMFKNPMKESNKNEVDISNLDVSVAQSLLTYIYSGKYSNLTVSSASELLQAADQYQLLDLKKVCCDFLKDNASLENVLRILVLGNLHSEDLKSFAVDFLCNNCTNFSEFQKREEWITLRNERPALSIDVLTSLLISRDQNKKG